ncbi:MAG: Transcriptional activator of acetoin dehydrogenase operon AcoR [Gammaproteobacteria bacterium]|nr:Transcriptional activator of acetoin dehydrogenase operon AcoR [Gammaproteobacteria bacterium]
MSNQIESQHAATVAGFVRGGADLGKPSAISSAIGASWRSCLIDYSLDPARNQEPFVLDGHTLKEYRNRHEHLIQVASAEIDWLYDHIAMSGCALLLTDAGGIVLYEKADPTILQTFRMAGLQLGADWSELRQGTNGMGTCIAENRPIIVHRDEHFRSCHIGLSCTAAPIHDPDGSLVAVLDASTLNAQGTRETQTHVMALVHLSAKLIEKCLFLRHFQRGSVLRFHARPEFVNLQHDGALALASDATVIAADEMAMRLLGVGQRCELIGRRIDEIFDMRAEEMVDGVSPSAQGLWPVRDAVLGRRYFASLSHEAGDIGFSRYRLRGSTRGADVMQLQPPASTKDILVLEDLAGEDLQMLRIVRSARRVANSAVSVMIQGATGTGKELFARALHAASGRSPFIALNCAAIPESLIESELFGYKSGAFTGARREGMKGTILQASGGTLFLDEIGDMPLALQTRLLRVLEEHEVVPLGAEKPMKVDLRVVCASHQNLRAMIARGLFREDLYYRLNGITLELPRLVDRTDKEQLMRKLLGAEANDGRPVAIETDAFQCLLDYDWPGNIRELRNVIRTALAICDGGVVRLRDLPSEVRLGASVVLAAEHPSRERDASESDDSDPGESLSPIEAAERQALVKAIRDTEGNMARAATVLQVSRSTLYRRCRRLRITHRGL